MKKKIIAVISGTAILIIAAGSIYGKFESSHKEGEPDVVGTFSVNRDENITVVANREDIEDREAFARKLLQMYKDDSFHSTKFSTDRGYATSIDMHIYLWKEDIEDGESMPKKSLWPTPWIANGATAANLSTAGGKLLSSCSENGARSSNTG